MSLETDVKTLASVPLLSEFSEDKLRLLAFSAENRSYRSGQPLFVAGDRADGGLVVASGRVALSRPGRAEPDAVAGPGSLIGEPALIAEGERGLNAVAVGDVQVILIRRPLFRRMLEEYPEVAARIHARYAARLSDTTSALMGVRRRLDRIGE